MLRTIKLKDKIVKFLRNEENRKDIVSSGNKAWLKIMARFISYMNSRIWNVWRWITVAISNNFDPFEHMYHVPIRTSIRKENIVGASIGL